MCLSTICYKNGSTDIVKLLLEKGVNTKVGYYGLTIFELSVKSRNLNTLKK
nr:ankyrin repeat protein [Oriental turtle dovepox virus]